VSIYPEIDPMDTGHYQIRIPLLHHLGLIFLANYLLFIYVRFATLISLLLCVKLIIQATTNAADKISGVNRPSKMVPTLIPSASVERATWINQACMPSQRGCCLGRVPENY